MVIQEETVLMKNSALKIANYPVPKLFYVHAGNFYNSITTVSEERNCECIIVATGETERSSEEVRVLSPTRKF